jgi:hypothetical protein
MADEHVHDLEKIGDGYHHDVRGSQSCAVYRCTICGVYGHQFALYLCGMRDQKIAPESSCPLVDAPAWEAEQEAARG